MASNNIYEQQSFNQELLNIDNCINDIDKQIDITCNELEKLNIKNKSLKQHNLNYIKLWQQSNIEKYNNLLMKMKKLDDFFYTNF